MHPNDTNYVPALVELDKVPGSSRSGSSIAAV